jgi:hypothetical protein
VQAGVALYLSYEPQSASDIYEGAKERGMPLEKVKNILNELAANRSIG